MATTSQRQNQMAQAAAAMAKLASKVEDMMNGFNEDNLDDAINSFPNFDDD